MSRPTCDGSKDTREPGVDVRTLLLILDDPKYPYDGPEYRVKDPRKLKALRNAGWIAIDISDSSELPLDNWGPVENQYHIPFNTERAFMEDFIPIFHKISDNTMNIILVSEDPGDFLKAVDAITFLDQIKDINLVITDKRTIKTPLN